MGRLCRALAFAAVLALVPGRGAEAGAWTQPAGKGVAIFSIGREAAPVAALASVSRAHDHDKLSAQVFAEYGWSDRLTLGGAIYADVSLNDATDGSAALSVFARRRLWRNDRGSVASVQVGGSLPFESWIADGFGASKPDSTPEIRIGPLYGTSWWGDWGSAFASTALGYAWRSEGAADEIRGELTTGYEPRGCCLAILSMYGAAPLAAGGDASLKIAPSLAWHRRDGGRRRFTLQLGLTYDLLDSDSGLGVQLSVWRPF